MWSCSVEGTASKCQKKTKHKFTPVPSPTRPYPPFLPSTFLSRHSCSCSPLPLLPQPLFSSLRDLASLYPFLYLLYSLVCLGYRSAVFAADTSGCSPLAGNLKKKNSHGVWQTRYFYLNNDFLIYKKDSRSTDIKGVVDVGDISSLSSTPKGDLTVVMNGGEELNLKGNDGRDASRWVAAIQERMDWVQREKELTEEGMASLAKSTDSTENSIKLSGWLMKKSPHKYGGMQERFVRLENNHLMYFKKEDDPNSASLGTINLESADWVRPYDSSNGNFFFLLL